MVCWKDQQLECQSHVTGTSCHRQVPYVSGLKRRNCKLNWLTGLGVPSREQWGREEGEYVENKWGPEVRTATRKGVLCKIAFDTHPEENVLPEMAGGELPWAGAGPIISWTCCSWGKVSTEGLPTEEDPGITFSFPCFHDRTATLAVFW